MLSVEERKNAAVKYFHWDISDVIVIEDLPLEEASLFSEYESIRNLCELGDAFDRGATREEITKRKRLREQYQGWMSRFEYKTGFQGHLAAKKGISDHVLLETLLSHFASAIKLVESGQWHSLKDPFLCYVYAFINAHQETGSAKARCMDLLIENWGDKEKLTWYWHTTHEIYTRNKQ